MVSEFSFGHWKCHFSSLEIWHFWQKCHNSGEAKWHFRCPYNNFETTFISPTSPKNYEYEFGFKHLPLLNGFSANSKYAKQSSPCQEACSGPKWPLGPLGGAGMAQVWCKGLNIGRAIKRECLVLLLMFLKHLRTLLGFYPSKRIFCHYTNTSGGYKPYPGLFPSHPQCFSW